MYVSDVSDNAGEWGYSAGNLSNQPVNVKSQEKISLMIDPLK